MDDLLGHDGDRRAFLGGAAPFLQSHDLIQGGHGRARV
jgi:hypothetical protein